MSKTGEIILTTEGTGELWNACVWDPSTGTALMTYKGANAAGPHGACLLGHDYLLLTDVAEPVLNAWPVNSPDPVKSVELNCTGQVNAMAVTPNGCFCVTAIKRSLMVWQIASGVMLAEVVGHYQPVTCIKFTHDNTYFISGGEDGQALVWHLPFVISVDCGEDFPEKTKPRFTFSEHRQPIKDIHVGFGGVRGRFVTVSLEKTCRLYDLALGQVLATFILSFSPTAVTMNPIETMLFVGAINGKILQLDLHSLPKTRDHHVTDEEKDFVGHSKAITCLSVSQNATILLSGSDDQQVILWDIPSRENIRTIEHSGPITNAFFAMAPKQMFCRDFEPVLVLCPFREMPDDEEGYTIKVRTTEDQWHRLHPAEHLGILGYRDLDLGAVGGIDDDISEEEEDDDDDYDDEEGEEKQTGIYYPEIRKKLIVASERNARLFVCNAEDVFEWCNDEKEKEEEANEDKKVEAEGESSSSGDSKSQRKQKAQKKHKGIGKKSKRQPPSPK